MKVNKNLSVMKRLVLLPLVLLLSLAAFAQKVSVEGTVTDERNEPIIGASVLEQGTSNGVATDPEVGLPSKWRETLRCAFPTLAIKPRS